MVKSDTEIKRVGRFGMVGVINTLIDFTVFNTVLGITTVGRVPASIISATCAMVFSFFANKQAVFRSHRGNMTLQAIRFFIATAIGLYVWRSGVIWVLSHTWTWPVAVGLHIAHLFGSSHFVADTKLADNGVLAAGTLVSMVWNYMTYKKVVFKNG